MMLRTFARSMMGLSVLAVLALGSSQSSLAQSRVNDKASRNNGASFFANERTSRNIQHARDYSRGIRHYAIESPAMQAAVTREESQMLGQQLQCVQRDLKIVHEEHASNPKLAEQVKKIETQLGQAVAIQKSLHEECCKSSPDGKTCAEMCSKLHASLDAMKKEHDKLLKELGHEDAAYHPAGGHEHHQQDSLTQKSGK